MAVAANRSMMRRQHSQHLIVLSVLFVGSFLLFASRLLWRLFPEAGMAANSQCKNPLASWDGKLMNVQVWHSTFDNRSPERFVKSNIRNGSFDRRRLYDEPASLVTEEEEDRFLFEVDSPLQLKHIHHRNRPVILWGSHHKTGTYLAQKMFSLLCAKMQWCCVFFVTRDSINSVKQWMELENTDVIGHSQWIWMPEELGVPYKFVHFYRKPIQKVISGYRYHMEGAEAWTMKPLDYNVLCRSDLINQSEKHHKVMSHFVNEAGLSIPLAVTKSIDSLPVSRDQVVEHCRGAHLCESCCRREHEAEYALWPSSNHVVQQAWNKLRHKYGNCHSSSIPPSSSNPQQHQKNGTESSAVILEENGSTDINHERNHRIFCESRRVSLLRENKEYKFICETLGQLNISLMDGLLQLDVNTGLSIEASLDFYENLRMARIYNHTRNDPNTINIELDEMMANYDDTMRKILYHLDLKLPKEDIESLVKSMSFFDVSRSSLYRWSMSNPFVNHINNNRNSNSKDYEHLIRSNEKLMELYKPILSLFHL